MSDFEETAAILERELIAYEEEDGLVLWELEGFLPEMEKIVGTYVIGAARRGSERPIRFLMGVVKKHPSSGLAWYTLSQAIALCDRDKKFLVEGKRAAGKAIEYGCEYVSRTAEGVAVTTIVDLFEGR